ncbi:MAG: carbohydrate ABC transporter permease [Spirochaetia bacterium]
MSLIKQKTLTVEVGDHQEKLEVNRPPAKQIAKNFLAKLPVHITVILICVIWLLPSIGLFVSSFRTQPAIAASGWWEAFVPPYRLTFHNYIHVLTRQGMLTAFFNSLTIAVPATVMPILVAAFAGYSLARLNFPGKNITFLLIVGLLVVPLQMTLVPILRIFNAINLTGKFPALWIAHSAYALSFAIYLLRNYIGELPKELFDIARIDGADNFTIFYRLIMPLSVPAIASLAIFQFIWAWNDLLVALVYLGGTPDVAPITVAISQLVGSWGRGWHYLTSAAFVSMVLPIVFFFSLQKYFIRGILAGSVKG